MFVASCSNTHRDVSKCTSNIILIPFGILLSDISVPDPVGSDIAECIWEVPSLNLGRENDYATEVFVVFLSRQREFPG
jgi:hypothetical protein